MSTLTTNPTPTQDPRAAGPTPSGPTVAPAVDIYQSAEELLIVADLPGVTRDGLELSYERGQIRIAGRPDTSPTSGTLLYGPRARPSYTRTFSIPGTIDVTRISAELDDGVLRLHLPKAELAKPRQIVVQTRT
jgi:HSP20 family protein